MPLKIKDIAWLAGLMEGEGCFGSWRNGARKKRKMIRAVISMSDKDVIERVASLLGRNLTIDKAPKIKGKYMYRVAVTGSQAAALMLTVFPLMGHRRRDKIYQCMKEWKSYKKWSHFLEPLVESA